MLCDLEPIEPAKLKRGPIDGRSLSPELLNTSFSAAPTGTRFVHSQRTQHPIKWRSCAVMTQQYRLINGEELYDITQDPGQQSDIAGEHPDVVKQLRAEYETWWASLSPVFDEVVRFDLGGAENPTTLMSHDWFMEGTTPSVWHHSYIREGRIGNGPFMVNIVKAGKYRITPMRWPEYVDKPSGCVSFKLDFAFNSSDPGVPAEMSTGGELDPTKPTKGIEVDLPAGPASLTSTLTREDGKEFGAYYVKVELIEAQP